MSFCSIKEAVAEIGAQCLPPALGGTLVGETIGGTSGDVESAVWDWGRVVDGHLANGAPLLSLQHRPPPPRSLQQSCQQLGSGARGAGEDDEEVTPATKGNSSAFGVFPAFF